jgi:hypothetical protein
MNKIKTIAKRFSFFARKSVTEIMCEDFLQRNLYRCEKYHTKGKLNRYEFSAFSQNGEDGIIEEIFNRIGTTNSYFAEFGSSDGLETNSTYLLFKGWSGLFIDGSKKNINAIKKNFAGVISQGRLKALCHFITAENIGNLFESVDVPKELDFLSIDIDRNDYYVWDALSRTYNPRVVCIEYNSVFRPGCEFVIPYDSTAMWDGTVNFGASIDSLYKLGVKLRYKLIACDFAGINAFFVREDLVENRFDEPFTPENHYMPPRYFLSASRSGHPRKFTL